MQNAIIFIKGDTLDWIELLLRDFFEYNNDDQNLLIKKMFGLYEGFKVEFKVVFGEVDKKKL